MGEGVKSAGGDRPDEWGLARLIPLGALMIPLAAIGWRRWCFPTIDFGHELYLPWRITRGTTLYGDVEYFMGPLSQYFNALAFGVFGVSYTTLILLNVALIFLCVVLIRRIFVVMTDPATASAACAAFLVLFAFAPSEEFNFVSPYLHEATHAVVLALLMIDALVRFAGSDESAARNRRFHLAAATFWLGLCFLTKAEGFVAALGAYLTSVCLFVVARRPPIRPVLRAVPAAAAVFIAPVLLATACLSLQMPFTTAATGVLGNWPYIFDPSLVGDDIFYRDRLGLTDIPKSVTSVLAALASFALVVGALLLPSLRRIARSRFRPAAVSVLVIALLAAVIVTPDGGMSIARGFPVIALGSLAVFGLAASGLLRRGRAGDAISASMHAAAVWSAFSLASVIKVVLNLTVGYYGFTLAMPATLLVIALLLHFLPARAARSPRFAGTEVSRNLARFALLLFLARATFVMGGEYAARTYRTGTGHDTVIHRYRDAGIVLDHAMDFLRGRLEARGGEATLMCLPQGALINYQLRMNNPTPYYMLTPWEVRAFGGEQAVLDAIRRSPPDYAALFNMPMAVFGKSYYGTDDEYGGRVVRWIQDEYKPVFRDGIDPASGIAWVVIYERR